MVSKVCRALYLGIRPVAELRISSDLGISRIHKKWYFCSMANIINHFFTQCARPEGLLGRIMLRFMNFGHAPLTNWGLSHVSFQDGWTMLDIGCGGGATLKRLLKRSQGGKAYGIDISSESIAKARNVNQSLIDKQVFLTQGTAAQLPYDDNMFDLVTAVETVYFWPDLSQCFKEVLRVLKSGSRFVIMLEVIDSDSKWADIVDGMTVYTPEQLRFILEKAGFVSAEIHRKKPTYATIMAIKP